MTCQGAPGSVCSVVICATLLRSDASAGSGNRVDLYAPRTFCLCVTFATAPSRTDHGKPQTYGIQMNLFLEPWSKIHHAAQLRQYFFLEGIQSRSGVSGDPLSGSHWSLRHPRGICWPNLLRVLLQCPVRPEPDAGKPPCLRATVTPPRAHCTGSVLGTCWKEGWTLAPASHLCLTLLEGALEFKKKPESVSIAALKKVKMHIFAAWWGSESLLVSEIHQWGRNSLSNKSKMVFFSFLRSSDL